MAVILNLYLLELKCWMPLRDAIYGRNSMGTLSVGVRFFFFPFIYGPPSLEIMVMVQLDAWIGGEVHIWGFE